MFENNLSIGNICFQNYYRATIVLVGILDTYLYKRVM